MAAPADLVAQIAALTDTLAVTRQAVERGQLVDMRGLDHAVADLCAKTNGLMAGERRVIVRGLTRLGDQLAELSGALIGQHQALREAEAAVSRRRAANAYSGAEGALTP